MTSIGSIGWIPGLGNKKSHFVHGWKVVCQKPGVIGWRIHTNCPRLEAITGGDVCVRGGGKRVDPLMKMIVYCDWRFYRLQTSTVCGLFLDSYSLTSDSYSKTTFSKVILTMVILCIIRKYVEINETLSCSMLNSFIQPTISDYLILVYSFLKAFFFFFFFFFLTYAIIIPALRFYSQIIFWF